MAAPPFKFVFVRRSLSQAEFGRAVVSHYVRVVAKRQFGVRERPWVFLNSCW